jgi:hypothetical protein
VRIAGMTWRNHATGEISGYRCLEFTLAGKGFHSLRFCGVSIRQGCIEGVT